MAIVTCLGKVFLALSHRFTINFESEFKTVVAGLAAFKLYNK